MSHPDGTGTGHGLSIEVDPHSGAPVFQQVCDQVVGAVREGRLVPGTRLPSVRALAADLGTAANTVAKAYKQLEAEGHVRTAGRHGTVVLDPGEGAPDEVVTAAQRLAETARAKGFDLDETIGVLRHTW